MDRDTGAEDQSMGEQQKADEYRCTECGVGRVVSEGNTPDEPCDRCGAESWEYCYTKEVGV